MKQLPLSGGRGSGVEIFPQSICRFYQCILLLCETKPDDLFITAISVERAQGNGRYPTLNGKLLCKCAVIKGGNLAVIGEHKITPVTWKELQWQSLHEF